MRTKKIPSDSSPVDKSDIYDGIEAGLSQSKTF